MKENELITMKEARMNLINREDVFTDARVKALSSFLLPKDFGATTQMVADYFEVGSVSAIKSLIKDNREELEGNGLRLTTKDELSSLKELGYISKNSGNVNVFTRRTILNVAMLLRDSEVAKQIRTVLLDATENTTVIKEIVKDNQEDFKDLLFAIYNGGQDAVIASKKITEIEIAKATKPLLETIDNKNKTIQQQENEIIHKEDMIIDLTKGIDIAEKRQRITQIVRYRAKGNYQERYNLLYREFNAKYHIDVQRRLKNGKENGAIKKSVNLMEYICSDKYLNMTNELYDLCIKIFESDFIELLEEWKDTINK